MTRTGWRARVPAVILLLLAALALPGTAQAMRYFVANALGEVKPEEKVTPAKPRPVQLLFEFQRDGGPNPKATKVVKPWVIENLKATGNFTDVVETPVEGGAVLSIKFNNLVIKEELDKAKKQAFGAGLGFGLFGGVVAVDHYAVSFDYIPATGVAPIHAEVRHELYAKYGKKDVEIPGTEIKGADAAVKTIVRQAIAKGANTIVADPAFPKE